MRGVETNNHFVRLDDHENVQLRSKRDHSTVRGVTCTDLLLYSLLEEQREQTLILRDVLSAVERPL